MRSRSHPLEAAVGGPAAGSESGITEENAGFGGLPTGSGMVPFSEMRVHEPVQSVVVGIKRGSAAVLARLEGLRARSGTPRPLLIGVTGPVGAGKSTLTRMLVEAAPGSLCLGTDHYLPDYDTLPEAEWDLPERSDLVLLATNLRDLAAGRATEVPVWTHERHRREGMRRVEAPPPGGLVVVEGIHALHDRVAGLYDLRIFVRASSDDRWGRWERLESTGVRTWGVEKARAFFHGVAEPTFGSRAEAYLAVADLVVENPG